MNIKEVKLSEALNTYLQRVSIHKKGYKQECYRVNTILKHSMSDKFVHEITRVDIATYRDDRLQAKVGKLDRTVSNNTVRLELALLSDLFNVGHIEWGICSDNPVTRVRKPKLPAGRDRRLRPYEERRILRAAAAHSNPELKVIIIVAIESAMRQGEILSLMWENINLRVGVAHLPNTKNGTSRDVPLSIRAREALISLGAKASGPVFTYTSEGFKGVFRMMLYRLKIEDLHFHDFRHEAISRLFELGTLDMMEVAAISGHKSLSMLKRYTHLKAHRLVPKLDAKRKAVKQAVKIFVPYPARITEHEDGFKKLEFIDIEPIEPIVGLMNDVMESAKNSLLRHLAGHLRSGKPLPVPSNHFDFDVQSGVVMIDPL